MRTDTTLDSFRASLRGNLIHAGDPDVLNGTRRCQYYRVSRLGADRTVQRPREDEKKPATPPRQASKESAPLQRSEGAQG